MTGDPLGVDEDERGSDPSEVKSIGSRMIEEDGRRGGGGGEGEEEGATN